MYAGSRVHWKSFFILALGAGLMGLCSSAKADNFSLGNASTFAVVGLAGTTTTRDQINNSLVTVNGNEGISQYGTLTNQAPSVINGNVYEYASGEYSGPGTLNGSVIVNPSFMSSADSSALTENAFAASLTPTQTFGAISSATTITGTSGVNVINITGGVNLNNANLTLTGPAGAIFIINISGSASLGGTASFALAGGVTDGNVLYNFTGPNGTSINTHVGDTINGIILAPNYKLTLDGTFNGEIIGGGAGDNIQLLSGVVVNGIPQAVPEPGVVALLVMGLLALVGFARWQQSPSAPIR